MILYVKNLKVMMLIKNIFKEAEFIYKYNLYCKIDYNWGTVTLVPRRRDKFK